VSNNEGLTFMGAITQTNLFGTGKSLSAQVNTSQVNRVYSISYTNPFYTDDGVSRGLEAFYRTSVPVIGNIGYYRVVTAGANVRFGVPFSELDTVFFGVGAERSAYYTYGPISGAASKSPLPYLNYVAKYGKSPFTDPTAIAGFKDRNNVDYYGVGSAINTTIPMTAIWQRDSRDSVITPSIGRYQRANLEISAIGNFKYYRAVYNQQYFKPVYRSLVLALNGEFDYGHGFGGSSYPLNKNFLAGGIGSVRGYEPASLGSRDANGDSLGGSTRLIGNAELQLPFPGADKSLRMFAFLDVGNVFDEGQKIRARDLRAGAGVGISWISPVGPLRLSFGKALNAKPEDKKKNFEFQMGAGF